MCGQKARVMWSFFTHAPFFWGGGRFWQHYFPKPKNKDLWSPSKKKKKKTLNALLHLHAQCVCVADVGQTRKNWFMW